MSDEFLRLSEQQEALRQITSSFDDLRRHADLLGDAHKQLEIGSAMKDFVRQEEAHRKILSGLSDVGGIAKIARDFGVDFLRQKEEHRKMLSGFTDVGSIAKIAEDFGADFFRQEQAHRKMLSGLADVGGMAKIAQDFERQRKLIEGPVDEARRLGLFDPQSDIRRAISTTIEAQQSYKDLFRLPEVSELGRIAHEAMERVDLARTVLGTEDRLRTAMETMRSPWLQIEESLASAKAFSEIIAMGRGIDSLRTPDHHFAAALRPGLGDWRELLIPASESLIDPFLRSRFYVKRGFDPDLTDFTTSAFDEGLRIAGLRKPKPTESGDVQQDSFARAKDACDRLLRFEVALRRFIERVMHAAFGDAWMKRQLPPNMLDNWIDKRDKALKAGHDEHPLIDYADFTDYRAIIERKDNWNAVFKSVFGRAEDVRESFQRLFPVRIATMHARLITRDDELLLLVETKRVLRAIGAK